VNLTPTPAQLPPHRAGLNALALPLKKRHAGNVRRGSNNGSFPSRLSGDRQLGEEALFPAKPRVAAQTHSGLFWVNNDRDDVGTGGNPDRDVWLPPNGATNNNDYSFGQIRTMRNLEDFSRLWICGMPTLPASQGYSVQIGWSQIESGAPKLRLYRASETNGGIGYLTNITICSQQILDYNYPVGEVTPTSSLSLPTSWFTNGLNRYFLFEAGGIGKGALTLTIYQGSNVIAQTSAWMDFHDIRDFYEEVAITSVIQTWPEMVQTNLNSSFAWRSAKANIGDAKQMAVFIHGWRMPYSDYQIFSQTMFKRLYWQGYQGKFATVRWPTRSPSTELFPGMDYITYNRSEHIAFESATGVAAYFNKLRERFPDHTISACAHSMGGIVVTETLKRLADASQQPLDNLVLMQAAIPAHCFDPNAASHQMFLNGEAVAPTPDTYRNYALGITNALRPGGKIANFFNPLDFALTTWRLNQAFYSANFLGNGVTTIKANTFLGYYTDGANSVLRTNTWNQGFLSTLYGGYYGNGPTRAITNMHELMPFVARPRSEAVGSLSGVHGQIAQELNLQNQLGFNDDPSDHSGQFNRNVQSPPVWPFYSQLKANLFPSP
jgi:pimeloyl-ACP methyl ester carboxylesterase